MNHKNPKQYNLGWREYVVFLYMHFIPAYKKYANIQ
jgi:hypothetical protein